jgi:hypothetical protein
VINMPQDIAIDLGLMDKPGAEKHAKRILRTPATEHGTKDEKRPPEVDFPRYSKGQVFPESKRILKKKTIKSLRSQPIPPETDY